MSLLPAILLAGLAAQAEPPRPPLAVASRSRCAPAADVQLLLTELSAGAPPGPGQEASIDEVDDPTPGRVTLTVRLHGGAAPPVERAVPDLPCAQATRTAASLLALWLGIELPAAPPDTPVPGARAPATEVGQPRPIVPVAVPAVPEPAEPAPATFATAAGQSGTAPAPSQAAAMAASTAPREPTGPSRWLPGHLALGLRGGATFSQGGDPAGESAAAEPGVGGAGLFVRAGDDRLSVLGSGDLWQAHLQPVTSGPQSEPGRVRWRRSVLGFGLSHDPGRLDAPVGLRLSGGLRLAATTVEGVDLARTRRATAWVPGLGLSVAFLARLTRHVKLLLDVGANLWLGSERVRISGAETFALPRLDVLALVGLEIAMPLRDPL